MKNIENAIEWLSTSERATVTLTQRSMITRIRKLSEKHPEVCRVVVENQDGSVVVHIPVDWIKISPPVMRLYSVDELARRTQLIQNHHKLSGNLTQNGTKTPLG